MQNKISMMSAIFIPLGFIGGLTQGSLLIAIGSAIFWAIIFLIVRPKH